MRLLIISSTFPSQDSDPVPAFVKEQAIALKQLSHNLDIHILAPHDQRSNTTSQSSHKHYEEHRFHYFWPFRYERLAGRGILPALKRNPWIYFQVPFFFLFEIYALYKLTKRIKPDLLYAHWFTPQALTCSIVSRLTHTPFIFTTHASDVSILRKIPGGKKIVRKIISQASLFTAVSQRTAKKLSSFFNDDEWAKNYAHKLSVIPMGTTLSSKFISDEEKHETLTRYGIDKSRKIIMCMGRLSEKKGFSYLIEGYSQLPKRIKAEYQLVIAGDGELKNILNSLVLEKKIDDNVVFTGFISGDVKGTMLDAATIFIIPSIIDSEGDSEGLPVVLMEALGKGKVTIATNVSGAEEILLDNCGILINQKSAKEIRDAICKIIHMSSLEYEQQKTNALNLASQFDWINVAKQHINIINSAVVSNNNLLDKMNKQSR